VSGRENGISEVLERNEANWYFWGCGYEMADLSRCITFSERG